MKIMDKREEFQKEAPIFKDLCIGDCFIDAQGDLCIKTDDDSCIYTTGDESWDKCTMNQWDEVVPLETTLTIEREK